LVRKIVSSKKQRLPAFGKIYLINKNSDFGGSSAFQKHYNSILL